MGLETRSLDPSRRVSLSPGLPQADKSASGRARPNLGTLKRLLTSPPLVVTASWAGCACPSRCVLAPGVLPDLFETGKIYLTIQYCKEISSPPINVWTE